jgi:uncharacterized LabA/DUF88 family protein
MLETIVFIDEGFLDKLTLFLGNGKRLKFNKFDFAKRISQNENLFCKYLFYYTAPPFQGNLPTKDEKKRRKGYDRFVLSLSKNKNVIVREGRCQKTFDKEGHAIFRQKGVDTLLTIDLGHLKDDFPSIKKIIIVSSDTDFCPAIEDIKKRDKIEVILYTYFDRKRHSKFSLSNELISCCSKWAKLEKSFFE